MRELKAVDYHNYRPYYPNVLAFCSHDMLQRSKVPIPGAWSYCSQCLRFFPPSWKFTTNHCLCGDLNGGQHSIFYFQCEKANRNLDALRAAVPYGDYMYFCAMATILLYVTCNDNWKNFAQIYQQDLKFLDDDQLQSCLLLMCNNVEKIIDISNEDEKDITIDFINKKYDECDFEVVKVDNRHVS